MAIGALFRFLDNRQRFIGSVPIDVITSEVYNFSNSITQHPTELGSNVNDHVFSNPLQISISGVVSRSSLKLLNGGLFGLGDRHKEAYQQLESIMNNKLPFSIIMDFKRYTNMVMQSLNVNNSVSNGEGLFFDCVLQQIVVATTFTVPFNENNLQERFIDIASSERDLGRQALRSFNG